MIKIKLNIGNSFLSYKKQVYKTGDIIEIEEENLKDYILLERKNSYSIIEEAATIIEQPEPVIEQTETIIEEAQAKKKKKDKE
jgi:hypothetical protein